MLNPTPMTKITVIGIQSHMKSVIGGLHKLGVLHITNHEKTDDIDIGSPLDQAETLAEEHIKLKSAMSILGVSEGESGADISTPVSKVLSSVKGIVENVHAEQTVIDEGKLRVKALRESLEKLRVLSLFSFNPSDLNSLDGFSLQVGSVKDPLALSSVRKKAQIETKEHGKEMVAAVLFPHNAKEDTLTRLSRAGFVPMQFDDLSTMTGTTPSEMASLQNEIKKTEEILATTEKKLKEISRKNCTMLQTAAKRLSIEIDKVNAPLRFGVTEKAFIVSGFIPTKEVLKLQRSLARITDDKVLMRIETFDKEEHIPVEMNNPAVVKPFEFFMNLYTLPKYKEFDPTFFTFLTFPFFFGFMLGDMGYGLITLLLFWFLKTKIPAAKNLLSTLMWASVVTIIMGALFGELFGMEIVAGYNLPRVLSRTHQQMDLLYLSIALGVFHINMGLIIGFFNELKQHGLKSAIFEKVSWIVLQIGAGLIALGSSLIGGIVIGGAVVMLFIGEGFKGLIELPSIFGNILSYSRLMALGLASISLAEIVNEFAGQFFASGKIGLIISAIFIILIGHGINIGLGILGPFLHSLRLHYVEFFSKFFKGGGIMYRPFGVKDYQK